MMFPPGFSGPYCQPVPWFPPLVPPAPIGTLTLSDPNQDSYAPEGHGESGHAEGGEHEGHGGSKLASALNEVKKHGAITLLIGGGTLLLNFVPGFKMTWPTAAKWAAANMGLSVLISLGLGVAKASHGSEGHGESSGH